MRRAVSGARLNPARPEGPASNEVVGEWGADGFFQRPICLQYPALRLKRVCSRPRGALQRGGHVPGILDSSRQMARQPKT